MSIITKLLDKISGRVSKDTVTLLTAVDQSGLITEFGEDALAALEQYEIVVPETRITIRRRTPGV